MRSDLDTVPSHRSEILSHDINRLLQHLHDLDQTRGLENRDLADNVHAIRDELRDLADYLRGRQSERPPPVPQKDQSVGRSSGGSIGDRGMLGADEPILLTPPPVRVPSPSSVSSSISFMSSHHSDDYSLMESESYPLGPASPPSSSSTSSPDPSTPTSPPMSATPSSSDITVRQWDGLPDLRDILDQLKDQGAALWEGQVSTNHMLDELRDRRPDNAELLNRFARLEDLVQQALDRSRQGPVPDDVSIYASGSDGMSDIDSLRRRWDELNRARGIRPPAQPIPVRAGPSLSDQLAEMLAAGPQLPPPGVQPPQPIITIVHHVQGPQYRSLSPILPAELPPRAHTEPVVEPVNFYPRTGGVPRTRRRPYLDRSRPLGTERPSDAAPIPTSAPFQQRLENLRRERRPDVPPARPVIVSLLVKSNTSSTYYFSVHSLLCMIDRKLLPLIWVVGVVVFLPHGIALDTALKL